MNRKLGPGRNMSIAAAALIVYFKYPTPVIRSKTMDHNVWLDHQIFWDKVIDIAGANLVPRKSRGYQIADRLKKSPYWKATKKETTPGGWVFEPTLKGSIYFHHHLKYLRRQIEIDYGNE